MGGGSPGVRQRPRRCGRTALGRVFLHAPAPPPVVRHNPEPPRGPARLEPVRAKDPQLVRVPAQGLHRGLCGARRPQWAAMTAKGNDLGCLGHDGDGAPRDGQITDWSLARDGAVHATSVTSTACSSTTSPTTSCAARRSAPVSPPAPAEEQSSTLHFSAMPRENRPR